MSLNIYEDFQIYISVPLIMSIENVRFGKEKDSWITTCDFFKCKVNGFDVKMEAFE